MKKTGACNRKGVMTAGQLIKRLERLDPKLPVFVGSYDVWPGVKVKVGMLANEDDEGNARHDWPKFKAVTIVPKYQD
jgi:hypothetical protein